MPDFGLSWNAVNTRITDRRVNRIPKRTPLDGLLMKKPNFRTGDSINLCENIAMASAMIEAIALTTIRLFSLKYLLAKQIKGQCHKYHPYEYLPKKTRDPELNALLTADPADTMINPDPTTGKIARQLG